MPSRSFLNTGTNQKVSFIFSPDFWPRTYDILSFSLWFTFRYHADTTSETEVRASRILLSKGAHVTCINVLQQTTSLNLPPMSLSCCYIFHHLAIWGCETGTMAQKRGGAWAEGSGSPGFQPQCNHLWAVWPGQTNEVFADSIFSSVKWR